MYRAILDPDALAQWLPPGDMTGVVHAFDAGEGGSFRISLTYADGERSRRGKTSQSTDTVEGRFVRLVPNEEIVGATEFDSTDPAFAGEMTVSWILAPAGNGTKVTVLCENIIRGFGPRTTRKAADPRWRSSRRSSAGEDHAGRSLQPMRTKIGRRRNRLQGGRENGAQGGLEGGSRKVPPTRRGFKLAELLQGETVGREFQWGEPTGKEQW